MGEWRCETCGGDCDPECGRHPMGCLYGGFTEASAYWLVVDGCKLNHPVPGVEEKSSE